MNVMLAALPLPPGAAPATPQKRPGYNLCPTCTTNLKWHTSKQCGECYSKAPLPASVPVSAYESEAHWLKLLGAAEREAQATPGLRVYDMYRTPTGYRHLPPGEAPRGSCHAVGRFVRMNSGIWQKNTIPPGKKVQAEDEETGE